MKIHKIFSLSHLPKKKDIPLPPISKYNPDNITIEEFRAFVSYLAKNNINRTFTEPTRFVTEAERAENKIFRDKIRYLAENNIDQTFYC